MDSLDQNANCVVVTCRINGKAASGDPVYGFFMCVLDSSELMYDGELFSQEPIGSNVSFSEAFELLNAPRPKQRPDEFAKYESELANFIKASRMFHSEKNLGDPKAQEHKITYFCTSVLALNAISFLEIREMSKRDLYFIMPSLKKTETPEKEAPPEKSRAAVGQPGEGGVSDIAVACDPVLDPVAGVAVGGLAEGMVVYCRLREGSVFHKLMKNFSPNFDGTVTGDVVAVSVSKLGSATVAMKLSEGVTGAMKLAGTVRVKVAAKQPEADEADKDPLAAVVLATGVVIVFLCLMALLLHLLT
jgi:hypothetical protein